MRKTRTKTVVKGNDFLLDIRDKSGWIGKQFYRSNATTDLYDNSRRYNQWPMLQIYKSFMIAEHCFDFMTKTAQFPWYLHDPTPALDFLSALSSGPEVDIANTHAAGRFDAKGPTAISERFSHLSYQPFWSTGWYQDANGKRWDKAWRKLRRRQGRTLCPAPQSNTSQPIVSQKALDEAANANVIGDTKERHARCTKPLSDLTLLVRHLRLDAVPTAHHAPILVPGCWIVVDGLSSFARCSQVFISGIDQLSLKLLPKRATPRPNPLRPILPQLARLQPRSPPSSSSRTSAHQTCSIIQEPGTQGPSAILQSAAADMSPHYAGRCERERYDGHLEVIMGYV